MYELLIGSDWRRGAMEDEFSSVGGEKSVDGSVALGRERVPVIMAEQENNR